MRNEECVDGDIERPHCTICGFEFDGPGLERIYHHPALTVPVCAICYDKLLLDLSQRERQNNQLGNGKIQLEHEDDGEIDNIENIDDIDRIDGEELNDYCIWCGEGGELLMCDTCPSCICEDCIHNQLGSSILAQIRNTDPWSCFVCDPSPLKCFQDFLKLQSQEDIFPTTLDDTISLLNLVEDEIIQCQHLHDDIDSRNQVLEAIRNELTKEGKSMQESEVEIQEWKQRWERHWERMNHRCSELQEHLEILGGNLALFYQHRDKQVRVWNPIYDLDRFAVPESPAQHSISAEPSSSPQNERKEQLPDNTLVCTSFLEYIHQQPDYQNPPPVQFLPTPPDDHEDDSNSSSSSDPEEDMVEPNDLKILAETDSVVQKYLDKPDPPNHSFPSAFRQYVPFAVLKALYYLPKFHPEKKHLVDHFKIPSSIQTVMNYARYDNSIDGFNHSCWPSLNIHPSVRKALFLGSSFEITTLAGHFGVPSQIHEIEEIETPRSSISGKVTIPPDHLEDIAALEDHMRMNEFQGSLEMPPPIRNHNDERDKRATHFSYVREKRDRREGSSKNYSLKRQRRDETAVQESLFTPHPEKESPLSNSSRDERRGKAELESGLVSYSQISEERSCNHNGLSATIQTNNRNHSHATKHGTVVSPIMLDDSDEEEEEEEEEEKNSKTKKKMKNYSNIAKKQKQKVEIDGEDEESDEENDKKEGDEVEVEEEAEVIEEPDKRCVVRASPSVVLVSREPRKRAPDYQDNFQLNTQEEYRDTRIKIMMKRSISDHLLPHQKEAVEFMWKNVMNGVLTWHHEKGKSSESVPIPQSFGCILAHCMGSGKTLSTLSFLATLLSHPILTSIKDSSSSNHSLIHRVLIICPVNVLLNWGIEFQRWIPQECRISQYTIDANMKREKRFEMLQSWYHRGGVCVIGKELYCNLIEDARKENGMETSSDASTFPRRKVIPPLPLLNFLISPGPDIVVIDEAHTIKNSSSRLYNVLRDIRTQRRISLTGSPLQNNLRELWNMAEFIRSGHLFKWEKFYNVFLRPIEDGSTKDSSRYQISQMKKKSYKLHSLLSGIMLRRGVDKLVNELAQKLEFVISLKLTNFQKFLYRLCMENVLKEKGRYLFKAWKRGSRIWNHPACLPLNLKSEFDHQNSPASILDQVYSYLDPVYRFFLNSSRQKDQLRTEDAEISSLQSSILDGDHSHDGAAVAAVGVGDSVDVGIGASFPVDDFDDEEEEEVTSKDVDDWWRKFPIDGEAQTLTHSEILKLGNKVVMFLLLLGNSISMGDKVLLFSQSLCTLDLLGTILQLNWGEILGDCCKLDPVQISAWRNWSEGTQYLRLDGSVAGIKRQELIAKFNSSPVCKLFLVSTMAGNMGINLQAANRVIIFDASWNPANDLQAIFRSYRYGQTKKVYVYRLLASGTVEERMYKRQVTKLNVSARVVDDQMPENAYTYHEIKNHFLAYESEGEDLLPLSQRMADLVSLDLVLLHSYQALPSAVKSIDDMDSLTMDVVEEHLDDNQKEEAEREFQKEFINTSLTPVQTRVPSPL